MKKYIVYLIFVVSFTSCSPKQNDTDKEKILIQNFSKDSVMQNIMYSNIDTFNGHWKITISKEQAMKKGIPSEIYVLFEKSINDVNQHIDSINKKNPDANMGYNLFPLKK